MSDKSAIEWTDATWNPTVGCTIVSPGCTNCYAMKAANGLERRFDSPKYRGLTKIVNGNAVWTGEVRLGEAALLQPLKWKRGRRIFVNSMSDLFHESLSDADIDRVFAVMALCPQHTFQVLTKRAERMRSYFARHDLGLRWAMAVHALGYPRPCVETALDWDHNNLPNVWLGVSAERQGEWDERTTYLSDTPAAVRFVSAEPLLGPIVAGPLSMMTLDWVIVGGESGSNAREHDLGWSRSIIAQCKTAGVAVFEKQLGANVVGPHANGVNKTTYRFKNKKGGDWSEWPEDLRVREFPVTDGSVVQPALASHENNREEATGS